METFSGYLRRIIKIPLFSAHHWYTEYYDETVGDY
jgi:hypothetical protein